MIPHNTKVTTCPPGKLPESKSNQPTILVATFRRTGTHLLLDIIFNNFASYKGSPLFIDLDQWAKSGRLISDIPTDIGCVIKTHIPNPFVMADLDSLAEFCNSENVKIITTSRSKQDIFKSIKSFFQFAVSTDEFEEQFHDFKTFWDNYSADEITFKDLTNMSKTGCIVNRIGHIIGVKPNKRLISVLPKSAKVRVFVIKLLTRSIGKFSPIINTTIGFSKTK